MKNIINFVIKLAFIFLILFLLIPIFGKGTWTQTMVTGVFLALVAYILGDLWILPKFGNLIAVVVDFGLVALVVWLMMKVLPQFTLRTTGIWVIALVLALGEWVFHLYLKATHAPGKEVDTP
jgi:uncharacterized membrane protein YcaP (DUF421 family)